MWTLRWKRLLWRKNLPWWSLIPWISVLRDCQWGWLYSWLFSRWSLVILLLMILMTTLMIIGMRERPGAPIIGPAGRLADRHQPGLCHHRQLCYHHHHHHRQPSLVIIASIVIIISVIIITNIILNMKRHWWNQICTKTFGLLGNECQNQNVKFSIINTIVGIVTVFVVTASLVMISLSTSA